MIAFASYATLYSKRFQGSLKEEGPQEIPGVFKRCVSEMFYEDPRELQGA